ncbi:DapH/DapD/GlmU-related protein [Christiangramia marina]|uniref:acyltransferase n=1 Tax=Christiangramia marina TaxID=409436 RepID=UPI003AA99677
MKKFISISHKAQIGKNVDIHPLALIEENAIIGDNTKIGPFCIVRSGARIGSNCKFTAYCEIRENVVIGDNTSFGSRCTISANARIGKNVVVKYSFVLTDTPKLEKGSFKEVGSIGDGALIGANVTLMPGCSIGRESIIGACSQVRTDVGDREVWYGNPARFFKPNE